MKFLTSLISSFSESSVAPSIKKNAAYSEDLEAVEKVLSQLPAEQARLLACLALLLGRVAYADMEISAGEKKRIKGILKEQMDLDEELATTVTVLALDKTLEISLEQHIIINEINTLANKQRKKQILRSLYHVACEDDISHIESNEIEIIAKGLKFSKNEIIDIRSEYREYLKILK